MEYMESGVAGVRQNAGQAGSTPATSIAMPRIICGASLFCVRLVPISFPNFHGFGSCSGHAFSLSNAQEIATVSSLHRGLAASIVVVRLASQGTVLQTLPAWPSVEHARG